MYHCPDIRLYVEVDGKAWVGRTEIDGSSIVDDPPAALCLRHVGEVELNRHAPRSEDIRIDAPPDIPREDGHVEVAVLERVLSVAEAPFAEVLNDRRKRAAGLREVPFGAPRVDTAALDDTDALQFLQTLGEQRL